MADGMSINGKMFSVCCERIGRSASCGNRTAYSLRVFQFAVFSLLLPVFSYAEELPDPTLPPASISAPVAVSGVAAVNQPAGLQSILIGKHRRAAIIDGQTVELGGKHNNATLVEVNAGNVVLRTAQGRQVLSLFPDVKITSKRDKADSPSNLKKVWTGTHKPATSMEKK